MFTQLFEQLVTVVTVKFTCHYESYLSTTVVISVCPYYKDFVFFFNIKEKHKTK